MKDRRNFGLLRALLFAFESPVVRNFPLFHPGGRVQREAHCYRCVAFSSFSPGSFFPSVPILPRFVPSLRFRKSPLQSESPAAFSPEAAPRPVRQKPWASAEQPWRGLLRRSGRKGETQIKSQSQRPGLLAGKDGGLMARFNYLRKYMLNIIIITFFKCIFKN